MTQFKAKTVWKYTINAKPTCQVSHLTFRVLKSVMVSFSFSKATVSFSQVSPQHVSRLQQHGSLDLGFDLHPLYSAVGHQGSWNEVSLPVAMLICCCSLAAKKLHGLITAHLCCRHHTNCMPQDKKNNINIPVTVLHYGPRIPKYKFI